MTHLTIRPAILPDAPALSVLIQNTVRITNAPDYDAPTIELICANFTVVKVIEKMGERDVFAAEWEQSLAGTVSLGKGKLHSLFVDPSFQGRGIGKVLVHHLETHAVEVGLSVLRLSSSISAKPFYEKLGYRLISFEERPDGSTYSMSKRLA